MSIDALNNAYTAVGETDYTVKNADNSAMDMDDFFTLLVAQLSNQDMFNTMDDSQFMNQMAQFSMIQALNDMKEVTNVTFGMSLVGKEATVASFDANGNLKTETGVIESVNLYNGSTEVMVNGNSYALSNVMTVSDSKNADLIDNVNLIGKEATLMAMDDSGNAQKITGLIDGVTKVDGKIEVLVNGKYYPMSDVLSLQNPTGSSEETPEGEEGEG